MNHVPHQSQGVALGGLQLWFDHYFSMEEFWDGGNLWVSVNGKEPTIVPNASFIGNGYPGYLKVSDDSDGQEYLSTNPLRGLPAFTGVRKEEEEEEEVRNRKRRERVTVLFTSFFPQGGAFKDSARGSWVRSMVSMSGLLSHNDNITGDSLTFLWRVSTDACTGWDGWYIDNVAMMSC